MDMKWEPISKPFACQPEDRIKGFTLTKKAMQDTWGNLTPYDYIKLKQLGVRGWIPVGYKRVYGTIERYKSICKVNIKDMLAKDYGVVYSVQYIGHCLSVLRKHGLIVCQERYPFRWEIAPPRKAAAKSTNGI